MINVKIELESLSTKEASLLLRKIAGKLSKGLLNHEESGSDFKLKMSTTGVKRELAKEENKITAKEYDAEDPMVRYENNEEGQTCMIIQSKINSM